MPIEIRIPRLGWSMEEGTFVRWRKSDGDAIQLGDVLFELEGEKALQDIEAVDAGVLRIPTNGPKPGEVVQVGAVVGFLVSGDESPGTVESEPTLPADRPSVVSTLACNDTPANSRSVQTDSAASLSMPDTVRSAQAISSPRARRVATELGIDWTSLHGTGANGRVRERDVRAAAGSAAPLAMQSTDGHESIPVSSIRKSIADGLSLSLRTAAHVTMSTTVDVTNLVEMRSEWKQAARENRQTAPTLTDAIIKLTAATLQRHPLLNARWEGNKIVLLRDINIGVAVDCDHGLLVPVIRNVARLPLHEVAAKSQDLIHRARAKTLSADELQGGTFTISNLGMFGIDVFTPIIRHGETGILGVGAVRRQPVVMAEDRIVARDVMTLNLSFDHRVVDGVPAARFLNALRQALENPAAELLNFS